MRAREAMGFRPGNGEIGIFLGFVASPNLESIVLGEGKYDCVWVSSRRLRSLRFCSALKSATAGRKNNHGTQAATPSTNEQLNQQTLLQRRLLKKVSAL
jgi:hypothetical protein